MNDLLNFSDAVALSTVLGAVKSGARVEWADDNGNVHDGVARHLVKDPDSAAFLHEADEVRDAYLRVSSTFEHFLPVRDVLRMVQAGLFAVTS